MDKRIRNIDKATYQALKAQAAISGKTLGEVVNEAIRLYLARPGAFPKRSSLRALKPEIYPKGNERLSEEIDTIQYGI
jgi:hypothetical protein